MKQLIFASNNHHKIDEIKKLMPVDVNVLSMQDVRINKHIEESGTTLIENALIKATAIFKITGTPVFADDSGLLVDCLKGKPGVYSARYATMEQSTLSNIDYLLLNMAGQPNRNAHFKTVIAYLDAQGQSFCFEGICNGKITHEKRGSNGFGYDPIFIPEQYAITFAEMSAEEKNVISHRKMAMENFINFLKRENS